MRSLLLLATVGCSFHPSGTAPGPPSDSTTPAGEGSVAPADAAPDAAAFDLTTCPSTYTLPLGPQRSLYRIVTGFEAAWDASDDCADDLPGATHLVVIDDATEQAAVQAIVNNPSSGIGNNAVWLGGIQRANQPSTSSGWIKLTGGDWIATWDVTTAPATPEPNDGNNSPGGTEHGGEQFVGLAQNRPGGIDYSGGGGQGAVCECDGRGLTSEAMMLIASYR